MAEEKDEVEVESPKAAKKNSKALVIIVVVATVILGGGGFMGYKLLAGKNTSSESHEAKAETETSVIALNPFVLNLADHGRYLKVTIQFEVSDDAKVEIVKAKTPQLRDTIITLVSSKTLNAISSPEGKFQLKDEVLFRANQIMGMDKDIFKNLYFTEFVMQ